MPELTAEIATSSVVVRIGEIPVCLNTTDAAFAGMLHERYTGFVDPVKQADIEFDIDLIPPRSTDPDADPRVTREGGRWCLTRGDFRAEWDPRSGLGSIRQSANPYSIDSVLRIVHTLILAREGGLLLHAASAIRNGKAYLFAGVSGSGKTTLSRLAPADATLLTDEISYVRKKEQGYVAFGTPFTGELAKLGENVSAPVAALYLLAKGPANRIDPIAPGQAARALLANILFFAEDEDLVRSAFHAAFEFVQALPVSRLTFTPDSRVWELIG